MNDYKELIKNLRINAEYCELPFSWMQDAYMDAADAIEQLVKERDAEPVRHGHWITKKTAAGATYTVCSHCNTSVKYNDEYGTVVMNLKGANYCPNCGAKMLDEVSE